MRMTSQQQPLPAFALLLLAASGAILTLLAAAWLSRLPAAPELVRREHPEEAGAVPLVYMVPRMGHLNEARRHNQELGAAEYSSCCPA